MPGNVGNVKALITEHGVQVCLETSGGKTAVVSISRDGMAALRLFANAPDAWRESVLPAAVAGEIRAIMNTYLAHLLGRPLKVARWLQPQQARRRSGS